MIDFRPFYKLLIEGPLSNWIETLPHLLNEWNQKIGSDPRFLEWCKVVKALPTLKADIIDVKNNVLADFASQLTQKQKFGDELKRLNPWRKGPYNLYGIYLDAEWRSDLKWERLKTHITPLTHRKVLDVGCNNGYHLWRMIGDGADLAIGIDPMPLYFCQFHAIRKCLNTISGIHFLPLGIEQLPKSNAFDSVFSMGVLYHRRSPLDHLFQLKNQLRPGGELILETLVIDGNENTVLVPGERYAQMRNVYFIPSVKALENWLYKCGYSQIRCVDISLTTIQEQRKTDWMTSDSLEQFLDKTDPTKTIEGYFAPKRAIFIANK